MLREVTAGEATPAEDRGPRGQRSIDPPDTSLPAGGPGVSPTSPLRLAGYAAILVALCFVQSPSTMVADTKFDLLTGPGRFLARGVRLWDAQAAFGQIPDQAYGYLWPMGPFFGALHSVDLSPWVIQRLWWALLLCLGFFGMLKLAEQLRLGSDLTRVVAGFAFVLTPRITTLIGTVSIEVWPMALAPWVLVPLVRGSERGSPRRAAALSALVVACCGGVNAVAVSAVLPLGLIWLLTRTPGPRRRMLLGWWVLFTALATLWWSGPLLLIGRYAPPFLDYIENASITTLPTDATRTLLGVSDWVAYFGGEHFTAGLHVIGTPYLLVDAGVIAALGLAGVCLGSNPHRRFLVLGVLAGLVLVGLGYSRDLAGFFADQRTEALDHALAPLRNLHKFDVVLRIPLVLGLAHVLSEIPQVFRGTGAVIARRIFRTTVALAVIGLLTPWVYTLIAAPAGVSAVPKYWKQAADYLASHDDGTVALELPASSFGVYAWGESHDDVLQGLARSPWAVRSVVPLVQPGNVVFLDAVTRAVESGRPSPYLAQYLGANGVGRIVVRNDLDRLKTGAPDPAYVRSVLTATPGLVRERSFGPLMGSPAFVYAPDAKKTRIVAGAGISGAMRAIDVYRVASPVQATMTDPSRVLVGDPSSPLDAGFPDSARVPSLLAADRVGPVTGQVLTDGMKRRETNFPAVRWNESSTMSGDQSFRLRGKEGSHRLVADQDRWDSLATWQGGVRSVTASSSQAYADANPPLDIGSHPGAVFDLDQATAWRSARDGDPNGQWWKVRFDSHRTVGTVSVGLAADSVHVAQLRISGGGQSRTVPAPAPGQTRQYVVGLPATSALRISTVYRGPLLIGAVGFSEVHVDDLVPQRFVRLPAPLAGVPTDAVSLTRDPDRLPCADVDTSFTCDPILAGAGEDGDTLARQFGVTPGEYDVQVTGSLRRTPAAWSPLLRASRVAVSESSPDQRDLATSAGALADGDPSTTWIASSRQPTLTLRLPQVTRLETLDLTLNPGAAASLPARVEISSGARHQVLDVDAEGHALLPNWRVKRLGVTIDSTHPAFSDEGTRYVELPPGITELKLNGSSLTSSVFTNYRADCGQGPKLLVNGSVFDTAFVGNVRDLVRGDSLPLQVCGPDAIDLSAENSLVAAPSPALRVDSITLVRKGARSSSSTALEVTRDSTDVPTGVTVPARSGVRVVSLPQNINSGWRATLAGKTLRPVRVDGWKQGWIIPPGPASTIALRFAPSSWFNAALVIGAVAFLVVVAAALPLRLRRRKRVEPPPLRTAAVGRIDGFLAIGVAGFLAGWFGLIAFGVVYWSAWRWAAIARTLRWGLPPATALLLACAGLTWGPLKDRSWALYWSQSFAVLAVTCVGVGLLSAGWSRGREPVLRKRPGRRASAEALPSSDAVGS